MSNKPECRPNSLEKYPYCVPSYDSAVIKGRNIELWLNDKSCFGATNCDIFEVIQGQGAWQMDMDDVGLQAYLQTYNESRKPHTFRAIFCAMNCDGKYPYVLSHLLLSQSTTRELLTTFNVCPNFAEILLNLDPSELFSGTHIKHNNRGGLDCIEYFCAYQYFCNRWNEKVSFAPLYVYMDHQLEHEDTTYLAFYDRKFYDVESIKQRLWGLCHNSSSEKSDAYSHPDAFMLHCMIGHESILNQRKSLDWPQRKLIRLFEELRTHIEHLSQREKLRDLILELDTIAQELDSHTYSLDRMLQNIEVLSSACHRLEAASYASTGVDGPIRSSQRIQRLRSLVKLEISKLSYLKSRRETGMNLVFNLVNQHDSQTNATIATESANIAREAKSDSSSMKTIAALTMVFLPGTFIAAIFGMNFFNYSTGHLELSEQWWLYVAITVPMTIVTIGVWWAWAYVSLLLAYICRCKGSRRRNKEVFPSRSNGSHPSEESV